MDYAPRAAFDAICWKLGDLLDFHDLILAAAQEVAIRRGDRQLADDIMHARERHAESV